MADGKKLYLLAGSNLGDRKDFLRQARLAVENQIGTITAASRLYHTQPWGLSEQPDFLNQALEVQTLLAPFEVLEAIQRIEKAMGRTKKKHWGERIIDLDILFYEGEVIETERLVIPHPRVQDRNFAMAPLAEIAPDLRHPVLGKTIETLLAASEDTLTAIPFTD